jgi:hypothetical protein
MPQMQPMPNMMNMQQFNMQQNNMMGGMNNNMQNNMMGNNSMGGMNNNMMMGGNMNMMGNMGMMNNNMQMNNNMFGNNNMMQNNMFNNQNTQQTPMNQSNSSVNMNKKTLPPASTNEAFKRSRAVSNISVTSFDGFDPDKIGNPNGSPKTIMKSNSKESVVSSNGDNNDNMPAQKRPKMASNYVASADAQQKLQNLAAGNTNQNNNNQNQQQGSQNQQNKNRKAINKR